MGIEAFRFDGKRALVLGGASGMGAAAAEILRDIGAEVIVLDIQDFDLPGVKVIHGDLRERQSIDDALAQIGGPIDALLCAAGVADDTPGIEQANFIGHRHVIDSLFASGSLPRGSAIAMISSVAGLGWEAQLPRLKEYLDTPDFDAASAWIKANPGTATYGWSKQAICAYVQRQAYEFLRRGVRINSIQPGPTDTPLARAHAETWLGFAQDYRDDTGVQAATPEQQAYPLVFLCSQAASNLTGANIINDAGYVSSGFTGSYDAPAIRMMLGLQG
jgi:NAD(P)-dependent dehydrogenase (short-subunit alcohol dehydrogenase family)